MAKTTSAGMDTALGKDLTFLSSAWLITRLDQQKFRFTTASRDIDIDAGDGDGVQTYSASEGYSRTNINNDAEMNVGNLDIAGVFDNAQLDETELRRGLFDFADVKVFFFDWNATGNSIVKIMRGTFGEIIVTDEGIFKVTLRDITTVFTRKLGQKTSKDCRDDLGGPFCLVPIYPDAIAINTAYTLGQFVRIPTAPDVDDQATIILNMEGADASTTFTMDGTFTTAPTVNGSAQIDTAQMPAGGDSTSSLLLNGTTDYLSWTDNSAFNPTIYPFTVQCHFRLNATGAIQIIASQWNETSDQCSWRFGVNVSDQLFAEISADGTTTADVTLAGTSTLTTGVDYHGVLVRQTDGDWILFLDGGIEDGPDTPTADPHNGTGPLRIGANESGGSPVNFFNGWIDSFELIVGHGRWDATFTPPTGNLSNVGTDYSTQLWEDFSDTIYEVTVAGTTGPAIALPDPTLDVAHNQGTVEVTARHSWMRTIQVSAVGSNDRRDFTVTELTPNTGDSPSTSQTPATLGFPDDWFNGGVVFWESGANAGILKPMEVRDFVADDGVTITQDIELFSDMPFSIQVGDKARIIPGCDKRFATCIAKFANWKRFMGEPYIPGADTLGQYPDASGG